MFECSNNMALEYYYYLYVLLFPSTNILGYSFLDFWTTKYIQIFVCTFLKLQTYSNICSEPFFHIYLPILIKEKKLRHTLSIKKYPVYSCV